MKTKQPGTDKHIRNVLILLLTVFLCLHCTKENPDPGNSLIGKWEWLETYAGWTGNKITPETEGFTQSSVYKKNYTFEHYKDGELVETGTYFIKEIEYDPQTKRRFLIMQGAEILLTINNDTLILSQAYLDGPTKVFKRID